MPLLPPHDIPLIFHYPLLQVTHVIIDEVDTMLTQGFGSDIRLVWTPLTPDVFADNSSLKTVSANPVVCVRGSCVGVSDDKLFED